MSTPVTGPSGPSPSARPQDASLGQLASQVSEQVARLVKDELALAKVEATDRAKHLGVGVGMFGGAGIFGFYAVGVFIAAAVLGLATAVDGWLAALIVGAALVLIAAVVALLGKKNVSQGSPPVPSEAIASTKADVATVREAVQR
ncbi:phage holin family protein [uncultured Jatrophihabitans sp.]|uniref:phage holin family protein n=1 Tax=uncultured Jatrophihabitans sp. TaxID=1610747 RepID=UPI0035CC64EE